MTCLGMAGEPPYLKIINKLELAKNELGRVGHLLANFADIPIYSPISDKNTQPFHLLQQSLTKRKSF